ncbi:MAG: DUF1311 domain-containing protein [Flavobacteriales bacterium]|nr:MAG: DUF1311 domain-containing protein [Flavobacteriales bacterium]
MGFEWASPLVMGMVLPVCVEAQVIPYFEGKLDCDTARNTLELSLCARHQLDSLEQALETLVAQQVHELDSMIEFGRWHVMASDEGDEQRLQDEALEADSVKTALVRDQASFKAYLNDHTSFVFELNKSGTGRTLLANEAGIRLVRERLALLRETFLE